MRIKLTEEERVERNRASKRRWVERNSEKIRMQQTKWRNDNPEKMREYRKKWYDNNPVKRDKWHKENPEKVRAIQRRWEEKNPEKLREKSRRWRENNPEKAKSANDRYAKNNPEKRKASKKKWNENNLVKRRTSWKRWFTNNLEKRRVWKNRIDVRFASLNSGRIRAAIKSQEGVKAGKSLELLGASILVARGHIEKQFKKDMTWGNWNLYTWHLDHIIGLANYDLTDPREQEKAFNYLNLRPYEAKLNLSKSDKIRPEDIEALTKVGGIHLLPKKYEITVG